MDENIEICQCTGIECHSCMDLKCPVVKRLIWYKTFIDPQDEELLEKYNNEEKTAD